MTIPETPDASAVSGFDPVIILRLLWSKKKVIIITTVIVTVLAVVISLILPEQFKSSAVLLPDADKSKLGSLGGLGDLAAMAGVGGGDGSMVKLYPAIIKSEAVLFNVIYKKYHSKEFSDSVNLIQLWDIKAKMPELDYETALLSLRTGLTVEMETKTLVATVSFITPEPQLTADIVNEVTFQLDRFMRTRKTTNATRQREWIEARVGEVKGDLSRAENNLKDFREKNRIVATSPQLMLEQERFIREVQINATLYTELKKQYEMIKIEEIKNLPIVSVMDPARPAAKKDSPKRSVIVLTGFFFSLFGSMGWFFIKDQYGATIAAFVRSILKK